MKPQKNLRKVCHGYTKTEKRKKAMRALARKILGSLHYYPEDAPWQLAEELARMVLR